jgi:hypothetical protein
MTQPLTVNVEKQELLARATELEAPIPGLPNEIQTLQGPCAFAGVSAAAEQLVLSANNMRTYLAVGERERGHLAESLRNAAAAYEDNDEQAAEALRTGTPVVPVPPKLADPGVHRGLLGDTPKALGATPADYTFQTVKQRASDLEQPDQGTAFLAFADAWDAYRIALLQAADRFRPFTEWSGTACSAVEANFDQQRSWLTGMASLCGQMVTQARTLVDTLRYALQKHVWFNDRHVDYAGILELEQIWVNQASKSKNPGVQKQWADTFASFQEQSDQIVADFQQKANLPLAPVNPPKPPEAYPIDPPSDSPDVPNDGGATLPDVPGELPGGTPDSPEIPSLPSADMPKTPSAPTGDIAGVKDVPAPALPKGGSPSLKPASAGLGGFGMPSMPLKGVPSTPLKDPYYAAPAAPVPAATGAAGPTLAAPGGRGAMGGGGMGAAPLGAQGADRGAGKAKRVGQEESSIYIESRAWTEGLIGRLPGPKNPADQKGQKS